MAVPCYVQIRDTSIGQHAKFQTLTARTIYTLLPRRQPVDFLLPGKINNSKFSQRLNNILFIKSPSSDV